MQWGTNIPTESSLAQTWQKGRPKAVEDTQGKQKRSSILDDSLRWNEDLSTEEPLPSESNYLIPLQPAVFSRLLVRTHGPSHVEPVASIGNTQPFDLTIPILLLPGEPLVARGDQCPHFAALLRVLLAYLLVRAWDLPPGQATCQPPSLVSQHVKLTPNDPDPLWEGASLDKDGRQERVTEVVADRDIGPVEGVGEAKQGVATGATRAVQGRLVPPRGSLLLRRDTQVGNGVDGDDAGCDPAADRGELADGEGQVATG